MRSLLCYPWGEQKALYGWALEKIQFVELLFLTGVGSERRENRKSGLWIWSQSCPNFCGVVRESQPDAGWDYGFVFKR